MRSFLLGFLLLLLPGVAKAADGLAGKVMCGYQGWFRVPEDGSKNGWHHYSGGKEFAPGSCGIDLWPDVRELAPGDRFSTPFKHPDGTAAEVFSSVRPATVALHFKWMREYGIDGVLLQRFATSTRDPRFRGPMDEILKACRKSAQEEGRCWAVMYDLSGLQPGNAQAVIADWKHLQNELRLADPDASYLRHRGKPLVSLWGLGFSDRAPMLDDWRTLITFFKKEAVPGGCSLMLGVPAYWQTLNRDSIADAALHTLMAEADVISPWTVGRYDSPKGAAGYAAKTLTPDIAWCRERKLDLLPVAFPGFSWHNLSKSRGREAKVDQIPRLGGRFLWSQCREFQKAGASMLYVAMFDELDEGTAIFKTRSDPPQGESLFVAEKDVPGDHYLWLTGMAGQLMRGKIKAEDEALPARKN